MSNHPFGLRGDPFVPPATLSAKEASRLIRRRVRACNGDGGLLYPIDTCDAIHSLAHGVPDQVLALAGRALAVAAAAGARAVSPAHVKQAAEAALAAATPEPGAEEPARTKAAEPLAPEPAHEPAPEPIQAQDEPEDADEPAWEPAFEPAHESIQALDELDDDLPPFRPASVALPTSPSEDLPQEAREWVSRFISGQPPAAPAAAVAPATMATTATPVARKPSRKTPRVPIAPEPPAPAPARAQVTRQPAPPERVAEAAYAAPPPRRGARPRPGHRRQNRSLPVIGVLVVVGVLAVVLRYSTPERLATPDAKSRRSVRTSAPANEGPVPTLSPLVEVTPSESQGQAPTAPPTGATSGEPLPVSSNDTRPGAGEAESEVAPAPARHAPAPYALEVASFIFEERARQERDRLAATGLRARVVTTLEFGSRVYRVVVGGYPHPAAAERAADSLLSNGVVLQARVITTGNTH